MSPSKARNKRDIVDQNSRRESVEMRRCFFSFVATSVALLYLAVSAPTALAQSNGIYADFTTSMGSFTCKLEYAIAPRTVANFIGLATGQRPWLDLKTGGTRTTPFYDGITFHRVVTNFVIQAGSPNGNGTDGPGYVFRDEIKPALRFTNPFMLAMANSGTNSNGSQFFVTVSPQPSLNDGYTIFGEVVGGTNVVKSINSVAVDLFSNKPLTNVVIQSIGIRREGTAAQAFDINTNGLPLVTNLALKIASISNQYALSFTNKLFVNNLLFDSDNLKDWYIEDLGTEISAPFTNRIFKLSEPVSHYYSAAQIQYAGSTYAPRYVTNRTCALKFSFNNATLTIKFDALGTGTYTYPPTGPGKVTTYAWLQEPYRGRLWPIYYGGNSNALFPMQLTLNFNTATSGWFEGTAYGPTPSHVDGTFTIN
jgi:peptidyl-prolyl cis-trans isomerase A (cyclophilin A)